MSASNHQINLDILRSASRAPIVQKLSDLACLQVSEWLRDTQFKTGEFLTAEGTRFRNFSCLKKNKTCNDVILTVIAATGPNHCMDGWTFFARSLSSLLSGDAHTARHLAYYAQLRSAMSILHCNGIGIFNGINLAVTSSGCLKSITDKMVPTHKATWNALQFWSEGTDSTNEFLNSIKFQNVSLIERMKEVCPDFSSNLLVSKIIYNWGIDLRTCSNDQSFRNISSYSAHAYNSTNSKLLQRLKLIRSIWDSLEPDGLGGYGTLDRQLLRKFLKLFEKHRKLDYSKLNPEIHGFDLEDLMDQNNVKESEDIFFLSWDRNQEVGNVHGMISRALILLRLATGVVRSVLSDAGISSQNLQNWFDIIGLERGIWSKGNHPVEIDELWNDVSVAVNYLQDYILSNQEDQFSFINFLDKEQGETLLHLSQAERACIWGLNY